MESKTQTVTIDQVTFEEWGTESGVPIYKTTPNLPINYNPFFSNTIKKTEISDVQGAFVLSDVLTEDECNQFIQLTEKMGYDEAKITTYGGMISRPDIRNNERVIWQAADCGKKFGIEFVI